MKKEATIYDYCNFCNSFKFCNECPLYGQYCSLDGKTDDDDLENINNIILNWLEEKKLSKTRIGKFKKLFPNGWFDNEDGLPIRGKGCPNAFDVSYKCPDDHNCGECYKKYWLEEIE